MSKIDDYISRNYMNNPFWWDEEVKKGINATRISKVFNLKQYLGGQHDVLHREDMKFKDKEFKVKKLIIQNAKTILNFHSTYLLGNPVSLVGSENMVDTFEEVYRKGGYQDIDFKLLDKICKFGDGFEYIYKDGDTITSKVIANEDAYPVFADDMSYIAFIEHWTNIEGISYWNVYYEDRVEEWTNEGSVMTMLGRYKNISGLPIHLHGISDVDDRFGEGLLENIKPILDEIEDLLSKMGDAIYTLSLNPLLFTTGQAIEGNGVSNDAVGYNVSMENGCTMNYVSATMDYSSIKYYLDSLQNELNMVGYMPSILGGSGNIANVSEVSLKLLYQLADVFAMMNEKVMRYGINKRFEVIAKLLGVEFTKEEYVNVSFNYSRPQNASELLDNMSKQFDMGAISKRTIIEKSPLTSDVGQELNRIDEEGLNSVANNQNDNE
ncbi:phage portal protein [Clostridium cibarium]|uniref:Phage portal protein n=1 Tax=Clostridium cibarium TaxID=2762247 RepID=A0ABR8PNP3_9CLOT|nr:phage portal protein [Clostridium cibarium]MBD7909730.1 phage portal protein [Clostridium cibarium]